MTGFYIHEQFHSDLPPTLNLQRKIRPVTGHEVPEGKRSSMLSSTSALDGGVADKRHAPTALSSGMRRGTHCTGGWLGHGAGLDG